MDKKFEDDLSSWFASKRIVPGNEARKIAIELCTWLEKSDDVEKQLASDELDVEEVKKDLKAIMQAIVAMSKVIETINQSIRDLRTVMEHPTPTLNEERHEEK